MRSKRAKNNNGIIVIILAIILVGAAVFGAVKFIKHQQEVKLEQERIEAEKKEAEKIRLEEEARIKAEAEEKARKEEEAKKLAAMKANIYYSGKDVKMYSDEALTQELAKRLPYQTKVITVSENKDAEGKVVSFKVKNPFDENQEVYIPAKRLKKEKYDWIDKPYPNAYYEPFERTEKQGNPPIKVKGVYVTQSAAKNAANLLDNVIDLARTTEINTFVIDVKDDNDNLLFYSKTAEKYLPKANEKVAIADMKAFVQKLKDENIYLIARIVVFKSPQFAKTYQETSLHYKDTNKIYADGDGIFWASPYNKDLWDYVVGLSKEAAEYGFNEIQFDYVRFPATTPKTDANLVFYNQNGQNKVECIQKFLMYAYENLKDSNVYIAADVFGWMATAIDDQNIGQHWEAMSNIVDYMAPMIYPSHYGKNNFGITYPDTKPYETVKASIQDAIERDMNIYTPAKLRPWIQDFTASYLGRIYGAGSYIKYGPAELKAQIKALEENGIEEFMLWNAGNQYTKGGLRPE